MTKFPLRFAIRLLRTGRSDRFLSVATLVAILGLSLGVAGLLISLSVIGGFEETYKEAVLKMNAHIVVMDAGEMEEVEKVIERLPPDLQREMRGWNPFVYREGMLIAGDELRGIVVKGVDLDRFRSLSGISMEYSASPLGKGVKPALLLGEELSRKLPADLQEIRLLFPSEISSKAIRIFRRGGTFRSGLFEYDSSFAFFPLEVAQGLFGMGEKVTGIEIWLKDPDRASYWVEKLREEFLFPTLVLSWRDLNENLFRALEMEKVVFFLFMFLLTGVASLNVLALLIMLLITKVRTISSLRTLGLSWSSLRKVFLFNGLLIGSVGLVLGVAVAFAVLFFLEKWQPIPLAPEVYFVSRIPVEYSWKNFLGVTASELILVGVGCLLTLRGISKLPILRSLVEA